MSVWVDGRETQLARTTGPRLRGILSEKEDLEVHQEHGPLLLQRMHRKSAGLPLFPRLPESAMQ